MRSQFPPCRAALTSLIWLLMLSPVVAPAQNAKTGGSAGGFRITAERQIIRPNGVRLEGSANKPARIQSPQIDVAAAVIAFDYAANAITQVRAQNGVNFKMNVGTGENAVQVEATCQNATLDAVPKNGRRTLLLTGEVNGFYQSGGARNTLRGQSATISFGTASARDLNVQLEGGAAGVRLEIPTATFGVSTSAGNLIVTSRDASVDQKSGLARFTGNARAVSAVQTPQGAQKLDVSAPNFIAKLAMGQSKGAQKLSSLQTQGRTSIVLDAPPAAPKADQKAVLPTHFEVQADEAVVEPEAQRLTLNGNVSGFYTVASGEGAAGAASTKYQFAGEKAVARFVAVKDATAQMPAGLNLEVTGQPVSVEVPNFGLGLE